MRSRPSVLCSVLAGAAVAVGAHAATGGSGGYRGPFNNGVFPAAGLLKKWPAEGPRLLWKQNVDDGFASVAVAGDRVYVVGGLMAQLYVFDLDGGLKARIPVGPATWKRFGGTRSTPLVAEGVAVATVPNSSIYGLDLQTRETRWQISAWKTFGSGKGDMGWGYPESPVLHGNKVIFNTCSRDDQTPPIVAVDIATGKPVWQADPGQGSKRYSASDVSGACFRHNGRDLVAWPTWRFLLCLDAQTGKTLWEIKDPGGPKTMTPVYNDGYLLWGPKEGKAWMLKLSPDGTGYEVLWTRPWNGGFSHAVILDGRVYIFGDARVRSTRPSKEESDKAEPPERPPDAGPDAPGAAGGKGVGNGLLCLDAQTGALIHAVPARGSAGHLVAADGMVYAMEKVSSGKGPMALLSLVRPTSKGFEVTGAFTPELTPNEAGMKEIEWHANVSPVIAEGRLFLRYGPLLVYDLRAEQPASGWRNDFQGLAPSACPPIRWSAGRNVLWKAELPGPGSSAPAAARDRVFAACEPSVLACVDASNGKMLWRKSLDKTASRPARTGESAGRRLPDPTPVYRDGRVFVAFRNGAVGCFDGAGAAQWQTAVETVEDRVVSSPLLSEETLILQAKDLEGMSVSKGEKSWSVPIPDPLPYGTPAKVRIDDVNVILTGWGTAVRAADGRTLAQGLPQALYSSAVVEDGRAWVCGGKPGGKGRVLASLRFPRVAAEGMKVEVVWQKEEGDAGVAGSPLCSEGLLYTLTDGGEIRVYDAMTGERLHARKLAPDAERGAWEAGRLLGVGDRIYVTGLAGNGLTAVLRSGPACEALWQYAVGCEAPDPAFVEDRQYVRAGNRLLAIGGATPTEPKAPAVVEIAPLAGDLAPGVPVSAFADDKIPENWVFVGPFPERSLDTDFLASLGGREKAIPAEGTAVSCRGTNIAFRALTGAYRWTDRRFTVGMPAIDVTAVVNRQVGRTTCFFTVIQNDRPRHVRFALLTPGGIGWNFRTRFEAVVVLGGRRIGEEETIALAPGRYPLMIQAVNGECESWGKIWMGPRFADISESHARREAEYRRNLTEWPAYQASLQQLFVLSP